MAVRSVCLTWDLQSIRVQEGSVDGSKYYPLFSWDSIVRYVRIGYSDILLSGRVPDVEGRVSVQKNPDCKVRSVTSLGTDVSPPSSLFLSCRGTGCSERRPKVGFLLLDRARLRSSRFSSSASRCLFCSLSLL